MLPNCWWGREIILWSDLAVGIGRASCFSKKRRFRWEGVEKVIQDWNLPAIKQYVIFVRIIGDYRVIHHVKAESVRRSFKNCKRTRPNNATRQVVNSKCRLFALSAWSQYVLHTFSVFLSVSDGCGCDCVNSTSSLHIVIFFKFIGG